MSSLPTLPGGTPCTLGFYAVGASLSPLPHPWWLLPQDRAQGLPVHSVPGWAHRRGVSALSDGKSSEGLRAAGHGFPQVQGERGVGFVFQSLRKCFM